MNRNFKSGGHYNTNTRKNDQKRTDNYRRNDGMECSHCHGTNHTIERCYHIIGFPPKKPNTNFSRNPDFHNNKVVAQASTNLAGGNSTIAHTDTDTSHSTNGQHTDVTLNNSLSTAQYQQLLQLLNQN